MELQTRIVQLAEATKEQRASISQLPAPDHNLFACGPAECELTRLVAERHQEVSRLLPNLPDDVRAVVSEIKDFIDEVGIEEIKKR